MEIVSGDQYEVLSFIDACNSQQHNPPTEAVLLWFQNRTPREARYRTVRRKSDMSSSSITSPLVTPGIFQDIMAPYKEFLQEYRKSIFGTWNTAGVESGYRREIVTPAETIIEHMVRLTWIEERPTPGQEELGLRVTKLGGALLRHAAAGTTTHRNTEVVVFDKNDPLAYPQLIGFFADQGPGLLIDPYLKLKDIETLITHTHLTRLLVSGKKSGRGGNDSILVQVQIYSDTVGFSRRVEIRSSTELHDRAVLTDEGEVYTIGTSLNGIGRTATTMVTMPSSVRDRLKQEYEQLWENGTPIEIETNTEDGPENDQ